MKTAQKLLYSFCYVTLAAGVWGASFSASATSAEPAPERVRELVHLVRQDCGSCHGLSLSGGLGPALLPEALADKPFEMLVATVIHGRQALAMPGWSPLFMSEDEAAWVVRQLLKGFPEETAEASK